LADTLVCISNVCRRLIVAFQRDGDDDCRRKAGAGRSVDRCNWVDINIIWSG